MSSSYNKKRGAPSSSNSAAKKPRFNPRNPSTLLSTATTTGNSDDDDDRDAVLDADVIGVRGNQHKRKAVNIDGYDSDSDGGGNFDLRAQQKSKDEKAAAKSKDAEQEDDDMFADLQSDIAADAAGADNNDSDGDGRSGVQRKGKKGVKFVDADDIIEGQEHTSRAGGHISSTILQNPSSRNRQRSGSVSSSSDSEVPDEARAEVASDIDDELGAGSKKMHAPKLDAFNMRSEQESGAFDSSGNYIRAEADPDAVHDVWLDGMSKKEMKKAREAHEARQREERERTMEADGKSIGDALRGLILLLERGETALEALARMGKGATQRKVGTKKKEKPWQKTKEQKRSTDHDGADGQSNGVSNGRSIGQSIGQSNGQRNGQSTSSTKLHTEDTGDTTDAAITNNQEGSADTAESHRRSQIDSLTSAADILLSNGQSEIYDTERELLIRQYSRETGLEWAEAIRPADLEERDDVEAKIAEKLAGNVWEYRWIDARDGGQTNGPFDGGMMRQWNEAGYFGDGVEFREVGTGDHGWSRVAAF